MEFISDLRRDKVFGRDLEKIKVRIGCGEIRGLKWQCRHRKLRPFGSLSDGARMGVNGGSAVQCEDDKGEERDNTVGPTGQRTRTRESEAG